MRKQKKNTELCHNCVFRQKAQENPILWQGVSEIPSLQSLLTFGNSVNFLNLHFVHPCKEAEVWLNAYMKLCYVKYMKENSMKKSFSFLLLVR